MMGEEEGGRDGYLPGEHCWCFQPHFTIYKLYFDTLDSWTY